MNDLDSQNTATEVKRQKPRKQSTGWKWLAIVLVLLFVLGIGAQLLGYINVSFKGVSRAGNTVAVCNDSIVEKYNDATQYKDVDGQFVRDEDAVKNIQTEVLALSEHEKDPTCQTIRFWHAINAKDFDTATELHKSIQSLHEQGLYANSNLRNNSPLFTYDQALSAINPANITNEEAPDGE